MYTYGNLHLVYIHTVQLLCVPSKAVDDDIIEVAVWSSRCCDVVSAGDVIA